MNLNRFVPALPSKRFGEMVHKYEDMYELSRHIIHAREVLKVAADTFEIIGRFSEDRPSIKRYKSRQPVKIFQFYSSFLTNLERRAESFDRRLQNEIQLVDTITYSWEGSYLYIC